MQIRTSRLRTTVWAAGGVAVLAVAGVVAATAGSSSAGTPRAVPDRSAHTASPVKHVVVIFDENVSFDHYFGTYPQAANTDGTKFVATTGTRRPDNLVTSGKLTHNPNLYDPSRLTPSQALTCDQNHAYTPEQEAANSGAMDQFVQKVSVDRCTGEFGAPGLSMDYFDGNTVTGLWNYAQQYSLSDRFFGSTYGPSTPGAVNLAAGNTHGIRAVDPVTHAQVTDPSVVAAPDANGVGTMINDPEPAYDDCSDTNHTASNNLGEMTGRNVGDLLNARGVTWGWFQGGFRPTTKYQGEGTYAVCGSRHANIGGASQVDYSPHHEPFQYYASTANPHHVPPSSEARIGSTDRANHQYDLTDFAATLRHGNLPAVSFLKAASYQDGHAGYSDPIDEQHFLVKEINAIQQSPQWKSTAVVVAYDDSDGWYDHVFAPISNSSHTADDAATCTSSTAPVRKGYQDRCGPGPRLPLLVISPWAKTNSIDHRRLEQASIIHFIEDNWSTGRIGDGSFDARAASMASMFDFTRSNNKQVILKSNGAVKSITPINGRRAVH